MYWRSSDPEAGSDYENSYWPPHTDPRWMPERPSQWNGEIGANTAGKAWRADVSAPEPVGGFSTEDAYFGLEDFSGMWTFSDGNPLDLRTYQESNNAGTAEIIQSITWFDCAGLPAGSYDRVELVIEVSRILRGDERSLTCDRVTSFSTYTDGNNEPYTPADFNESDVLGTALSPASETLQAIEERTTPLLDPLLTSAFDTWLAWPLSESAAIAAKAGQKIGLRFRLHPVNGRPPPFDDNRLDISHDNVAVENWIADGRPLADFENTDFAIHIPRLRFWRGAQEVTLAGRGQIEIGGRGRMAPPESGALFHRARLMRNRRG